MKRKDTGKFAARPSSAKGYRRPALHFSDKPKKRRNALIPLLLGSAGILVGILLFRQWDYGQARREYEAYGQPPVIAAQNEAIREQQQAPLPAFTSVPVRSLIAVSPPPQKPVLTPAPEPFYSEQVRKLMRQNADTVAYLNVLETAIQYPVVQGKDNEYYSTHTFAKKRRAAGAIFMDAWNDRKFSDFNTVIYGHNMKDGSMFSTMREYRHANFLRDHKYIEITLLNSKRSYKVFSAYMVKDDFDFRGFEHSTNQQRDVFIRQIINKSEINTNTEATAADSLLTLVTCASENREWYWVVHAVLTGTVTEAQAPPFAI